MLDLLKLRIQHGKQAIKNIRKAELLSAFRGFPVIDESKCDDGGKKAKDICPTNAIDLNPLNIDLGKCTFCGECERVYSNGAIKFTPQYRLGSTDRDKLIITSGKTFQTFDKEAIEAKKEIHKLFGRSLKLRQVSAGGCNGCEMELAATTNVNFDMGRFGIDFVASPRHADGIVVTGTISKNMAPALMDAYKSVSEPRIVIAVGACAISGGLFVESNQINRKFFDEVPVDLYIPGCPTHPLTFIHAVLDYLGRK
ncbi:MAG: NADH-quinone oxidoreductase subunit NuoB [Ignavibacteriales bacterium]|nr:NADH-quinone oxidoreductase subunit NuoB [Ignavibacteriales bacterium]